MAKPSRAANRLVALSSLAVLGIYTAGFVRTRPAAQQLEDEENRPRRRAAATSTSDNVAAPQPASAQGPSGAVVTFAPATAPRAAPGPIAESTAAAAVPTARRPATPPTSSPTPSAPSPASVGTEPAVTSAQARPTSPEPTSVPAPQPATAAIVGNTPTGTTTAPEAAGAVAIAPATLAAPAASPAAPPRPVYKDGTYTGWGTSRHGDIQAAVVIEGGRIASVTIAQCLTRYSCSWIAALPPQVVARQSPETDYVSGATQSTNALYYAVVEALAKAR